MELGLQPVGQDQRVGQRAGKARTPTWFAAAALTTVREWQDGTLAHSVCWDGGGEHAGTEGIVEQDWYDGQHDRTGAHIQRDTVTS